MLRPARGRHLSPGRRPRRFFFSLYCDQNRENGAAKALPRKARGNGTVPGDGAGEDPLESDGHHPLYRSADEPRGDEKRKAKKNERKEERK